MPNYRRADSPGATYFFTVNTHSRQPWLVNEDVRQALREAIELTRARYNFEIDAWVLLPDHLHCIWTLPPDDADFSIRWALIKQHVSNACALRYVDPKKFNASQRKRGESGFCQRRFWEHLIRDEIDYERHVDYIHWNPVKHGYIDRCIDWPYSTFHRFAARGVYPIDWAISESAFDDGTFPE
ncbi:MAG: transposase [Pseudomonadota bacterium]|nr:transposase [Pseudomonadota bacterium]